MSTQPLFFPSFYSECSTFHDWLHILPLHTELISACLIFSHLKLGSQLPKSKAFSKERQLYPPSCLSDRAAWLSSAILHMCILHSSEHRGKKKKKETNYNAFSKGFFKKQLTFKQAKINFH